ncbi:hypothetical protein FIBSPDRAFT_939575, partial [Athelia psychrophila]
MLIPIRCDHLEPTDPPSSITMPRFKRVLPATPQPWETCNGSLWALGRFVVYGNGDMEPTLLMVSSPLSHGTRPRVFSRNCARLVAVPRISRPASSSPPPDPIHFQSTSGPLLNTTTEHQMQDQRLCSRCEVLLSAHTHRADRLFSRLCSLNQLAFCPSPSPSPCALPFPLHPLHYFFLCPR